jgi:hypothetical protein
MASVLAIGPKVCGFKPGRVDRFVRAIEICSAPSFGGVGNLPAPFRNFYGIKKSLTYEKRYFEGHIHNFLRQVPPDLLLDESASRIARELWWTNQELSPCRYRSVMVLHAYISSGGGRMNNK